MCTERHTLSHGRHDETVSDGEQRQILRECEILSLEEYDRLVGKRRELHVDPSDDIRYIALKFVDSRGGKCNLYQHDLNK